MWKKVFSEKTEFIWFNLRFSFNLDETVFSFKSSVLVCVHVCSSASGLLRLNIGIKSETLNRIQRKRKKPVLFNQESFILNLKLLVSLLEIQKLRAERRRAVQRRSAVSSSNRQTDSPLSFDLTDLFKPLLRLKALFFPPAVKLFVCRQKTVIFSLFIPGRLQMFVVLLMKSDFRTVSSRDVQLFKDSNFSFSINSNVETFKPLQDHFTSVL